MEHALENTLMRARVLVGLVRENLPVEVPDNGRVATWPLVGLALMARCAGTLEALIELDRSPHFSDSATLARSLYEHTVHLAWLAADPSPARLEAWQKDDLRQVLVADRETRARSFPLLEPDERAALEARFDTMKGEPLKLADLAVAADQRWGGKLTGIGHHSEAGSFRGLYAVTYRFTSTRAHPSYRGTTPVVTQTSRTRSTVHMEADGHRPAWRALGTGTMLVGLALFICEETFDWPVRDRALHAFEQFPG
jgi:hypothetical protein